MPIDFISLRPSGWFLVRFIHLLPFAHKQTNRHLRLTKLFFYFFPFPRPALSPLELKQATGRSSRHSSRSPPLPPTMASKLVLILVTVFDLIAFGLAVAAEQRRSTAQVVPDSEKNYNYCVYDSDIATGFGAGAFLFLLISQIIIVGATKCFCCGSSLRPGGSRACALLLFLICWLTFIIAEMCLLAGSVRNAYHTRYRTLFFVDPPTCQTLRKGVFGAGAAFTVFTGIISEIYYVCYSKASDTGLPPYGYPK